MAEQVDGTSSRKTALLSFTESIIVHVGTEKKEFSVHQDVICSRSTFFRAACSPQWAQSSRIIEMPEDVPHGFDLYLHCVYKDKVELGDLDRSLNRENKSNASVWAMDCLIRVYALADKMGDTITANMVVDNLIDRCNGMTLPGSAALQLAFEITTAQSPVQRLLTDGYAHEAGVDAVKECCEDENTPNGFLRGVLLEKARLEAEHPSKPVDDVFQENFLLQHKCRYHQHDKEHPICGEGCEKKT